VDEQHHIYFLCLGLVTSSNAPENNASRKGQTDMSGYRQGLREMRKEQMPTKMPTLSLEAKKNMQVKYDGKKK